MLSAGTRVRYPTVLAVGATPEHEADMSSLAAEHNVDLIRIPGLGRDAGVLGDFRALWALWRLCRRLQPDVMHTHTAKAGTLGRLAAWLARVPVRVHTFHGHVFHGYFARWRTAIYVAIERALARITSRIIAISPRQAEELQRHLGVPADRISVIPLGFDLSRFATADRPAARTRFRRSIQATDEEVAITMVGRLTGIKNHALALRAFAALTPAARRSALMVFVGGGELETPLRELAQDLGIADRVRFAGWWNGSDLPAVYYGSEIVALSSDNEGTPVCLIEALACGRAVIATDVGGVADVLEEGRLGLIVPPGRPDAFTDGLTRLLDRAERARYETQDRSSVLARYSVTRLVADVEALYDALAVMA